MEEVPLAAPLEVRPSPEVHLVVPEVRLVVLEVRLVDQEVLADQGDLEAQVVPGVSRILQSCMVVEQI